MIFSSFIFILFISNNLFQSSFGYGSGPPLTQIICETLNPIGHMGRNRKNDSLNFEVTTDRDWFSPGEVVESKSMHVKVQVLNRANLDLLLFF